MLDAEFRFHLVPYDTRVLASAVMMVISFLTVGFGRSPGVQLIGVGFSALQGGLGEASFLALASFYDTPRALTAWSSGTGFAGIFGYAWVFILHIAMGLSAEVTLSAACLLSVAWLLSYFKLLNSPGNRCFGGSSVVVEIRGHEESLNSYSPLASSQPTQNDTRGVEGTAPSSRHKGRASGDTVFFGDANYDAASMTTLERLRFTLSLWPFMVPLMLVFFAEVSRAGRPPPAARTSSPAASRPSTRG